MPPSLASDKLAPTKVRKLPYLLPLFLFIISNHFAGEIIGNQGEPWLLITVSVIAATAMAYALWRAERDLMRSQDELQQKIRTEALAHALPVALGIVMLLGRLGEAGLALIPSHAYWIPAALPYLFILEWFKRRYR